MSIKTSDTYQISIKSYLLEKLELSPMIVLLLFFLIYDSHYNKYLFVGTPIVLIIILILFLLKLKRFLIYLFITIWLMITVYQAVFITSNLTQDLGSDRDDAVEISSIAFLNGQNPWKSQSQLNNPITTGPSSILISIPSVALMGKINAATFLFWLVFITILIVADIYYANNSFIFLVLLILLPVFKFQHTILYGLEELYYALLLFPLLWIMLKRQLFFLSGIAFSIIILSRLSYLFLCAGMFFWWIIQYKYYSKNYLKILGGFIIGVLLILIPFIVISGKSFFESNFIINSFLDTNALRGNNLAILYIQGIELYIGNWAGKIFLSVIILILIFLFNLVLSRNKETNPFWHMSFASLLAFTIIFTPLYSSEDYILSMIIPLFFAISFNPKINY